MNNEQRIIYRTDSQETSSPLTMLYVLGMLIGAIWLSTWLYVPGMP